MFHAPLSRHATFLEAERSEVGVKQERSPFTPCFSSESALLFICQISLGAFSPSHVQRALGTQSHCHPPPPHPPQKVWWDLITVLISSHLSDGSPGWFSHADHGLSWRNQGAPGNHRLRSSAQLRSKHRSGSSTPDQIILIHTQIIPLSGLRSQD